MMHPSWMLCCFGISALTRMSITETVMDFLITVLSCSICHPKFFHLAPGLLKLNCFLSCGNIHMKWKRLDEAVYLLHHKWKCCKWLCPVWDNVSLQFHVYVSMPCTDSSNCYASSVVLEYEYIWMQEPKCIMCAEIKICRREYKGKPHDATYFHCSCTQYTYTIRGWKSSMKV